MELEDRIKNAAGDWTSQQIYVARKCTT
jgi:hypothetical protein